MAQSIGTISVDLEAKIAKFTENLRQAEGNLRNSSQRMQGSLDKIQGGFTALGRGAATALGALGAAALVNLARQSIDAAGGLGELAEQMGVTTDTLQVFQFAALETGNSVEEIQSALAKFSKNVGEAAEGNGTLIATFDRLGVKILDASGNLRSTDDLIRDFAEAIAQIEDPAKRAAAVAELMGKGGQKLLPILSQGAKGLDDFAARAQAAGYVLDKDLIAAADKAGDQLSVFLNTLAKNTQTLLVREVLPGWQAFADLIASIGKRDTAAVAAELAGVTAKIEGLVAARDELVAKLGDNRGRGIGARQIADLDKQIAELNAKRGELLRLSGQQARPVQAGEDQPAAGKGAKNPLSDQVKKDIETAQKQIDEFRRKGKALSDPRGAFVDSAVSKLPTGATADQVAQVKELAAAEYDRTEGLKLLNAEISQYLDTVKAETDAQAEQIRIRSDADEATSKAISGLEDEVAANQRLLDALGQGIDAYEKTKAEIEVLNQLKALGVQLDDQTIDRAKELAGELGEQRKKIGEAEDGIRAQREAWGDLTRVIGTGLEDAFLRGAKASDILKGALEDVTRVLLRMAITKPLENALTGAGGGSGGGIFGSILGSIFGNGGIFGGVPGNGPGPVSGFSSSYTPISFEGFANEGSFKVGGVGGIDSKLVAFRATPGEMVDVRHGGDDGGGGSVVIHNYSSERVTARQGRSQGGERNTEVVIGEMVGRELRRSGSPANRAFRETFATSPNLSAR